MWKTQNPFSAISRTKIGGILFSLNSGCLDLFPATPQADPRLAVVTRNGYVQNFRGEPIRAHELFPVLRRTARRRQNRQSEGKDFSPTIWRLAVGVQMPSLLWQLVVGAPALERANWSQTQNFE